MEITEINWDGTPIRIRPSSIDNFFTCPFQWAKVFLEGVNTIPSARATIGTAVHKGAEELWKEAQLYKSKDQVNITMAVDAAIQEFQDLDQDLYYDPGENSNTAEELVHDGVRTFVEDIVPFADIPVGIEEQIIMPIDHPVVCELGGTIDYRTPTEIADLKTSKRKPSATSHITQQTTYKILAEYDGNIVDRNFIHGIAFTKQPLGHILELEPNVPRTKFLINSMLDTLEAFHDGGDPKVLFRGNNNHYLCDPRYCSLYNNGCPYVNGAAA